MSPEATAGGGPPAGRYERKFLVRELSLHEVESIVRVHPALFRTTFPPRWVNNVYFDLPGLDNFTANVDGAMRRVKLRVRWYGDLHGRVERPVLERKAKHGLFGTKEVFELPPLELSPGFAGRAIEAHVAGAGLPGAVREQALAQDAVLLNRYRRSYFLSADGRFRLTLDSALEFRPVGRLGGGGLFRADERDTVVVELKYDAELDVQAERIASAFPFRLTKSSKYAAGIERLLVQ
jgi:hypothetical protein